jgi:cytochrome c oxidase subunit 4
MRDVSKSSRHLWALPLTLWVVLVLLLGLTTTLGYANLGNENVAANFGVAAIMVALLAIFLMRLRAAAGVIWLAALTGIMFLLMMFLLTFGDYFTRP